MDLPSQTASSREPTIPRGVFIELICKDLKLSSFLRWTQSNSGFVDLGGGAKGKDHKPLRKTTHQAARH